MPHIALPCDYVFAALRATEKLISTSDWDWSNRPTARRRFALSIGCAILSCSVYPSAESARSWCSFLWSSLALVHQTIYRWQAAACLTYRYKYTSCWCGMERIFNAESLNTLRCCPLQIVLTLNALKLSKCRPSKLGLNGVIYQTNHWYGVDTHNAF